MVLRRTTSVHVEKRISVSFTVDRGDPEAKPYAIVMVVNSDAESEFPIIDLSIGLGNGE